MDGWKKSRTKIGTTIFSLYDSRFCLPCSQSNYCDQRSQGVPCSLMDIEVSPSFVEIKLYKADERNVSGEKTYVELSILKKDLTQKFAKRKLSAQEEEDVQATAKQMDFDLNEYREVVRKVPANETTTKIHFQKRAEERMCYDKIPFPELLNIVNEIPISNRKHHPTTFDVNFLIKLVKDSELPSEYQKAYSMIEGVVKQKGVPCKD